MRPTKIAKPDPDGDLTLNVAPRENEPCSFRVCSATLRRNSPVWKAMLFGPSWMESKPADGENWVVELPEDPAYPMEIILDIIHGRLEGVPQTLGLKDLRDLLVLTNKYDMTGLVRPWCAQWIKAARRPILDTDDILRSLFIAWELGDEYLFALRLEDIALRTKVDDKGRFNYTASVPTEKIRSFSDLDESDDHYITFEPSEKDAILEDEDHVGPQDALDIISSIRETLLTNLVTPIHEELDSRIRSDSYYCRSTKSPASSVCDAVVIGQIHRNMLQVRGSTLPRSVSDINDSVVELASWLFSLMSAIPTLHTEADNRRALECHPRRKFSKLNKKIHESIPALVASSINPSHKEYMAKQRVKTGLVMATEQDRSKLRRYWTLW
ncbi:hypothetical protein QBC32DRAFT_367509 [Pseudoneurospora amorphoporcata]|uniref:BTB domain-containing protein n=1 Tax=Pseudoneurospora amorphoporcata TaxID=241081 RepID=A0AAN6SJR4_9PEZI|nr:hypothetical protein QBC32DRAFT_367509 [Pseudoneurospora amorphoporcata]